MRLDRTVRFYVDVVLRDLEDQTSGMWFDQAVRETQQCIQLTDSTPLQLRDETFTVNYGGVVASKEAPRED